MILLESWWFFLPILLANQCPGLAAKMGLPGAHTPVSPQWLGKNKTFAAYYVGPFGGIVAVMIQKQCLTWSAPFSLINYTDPNLLMTGAVLGYGAVFGDHIKSFIKRGFDIASGAPWWPFDQIDYAVGGIFIAYLTLGWVGWEQAFIICLTALMIHPIGNRIGYQLGLRKVPW